MLEGAVNAAALVVDGLLVGAAVSLAYAFYRLGTALRERDLERAAAARRNVPVLGATAAVLAVLVFIPPIRFAIGTFASSVALGFAIGVAAFQVGRSRSGTMLDPPRLGPPVGTPIATSLLLVIVTGGVAVAETQPRTPAPTPVPSTSPLAVTASPAERTATPTATAAPTPTATRVATASPVPRYQLSVKVAGGGIVASVPAGEIRCPPACTASVPAGNRVTLRALPDAVTILKGWDGACAGTGDCVLTVTAPVNVTATFTRPTLTVTTTGPGGGQVLSDLPGIACPSACAAAFDRGARVALRPRADFGSLLAGWSGGCTGSSDCAVTVDADKAVGAAFAYRTAPGFDAALCSEPAPFFLREGDNATFAVCFENRGAVTWTVGTQSQVNLAVCCPLNSASPNATWGAGWLSPSAYATASTKSVAPGQRAFFSYRITVPKPTSAGEYRLGGELVVASTGAPVRLVNYTQVVTVR